MARIQEFEFSTNLLASLLWQHDNASRLRAIVEAEQRWFDEHQTAFWSNWVRDVFDLRTANNFGLSVWAIILNMPLLVFVESSGTREVFGFEPYGLNFSNGNFGRDSDAALSLTTEQRRLALRLRYFQLVSRGTVPEVNQFLKELFGDQGPAYVLDGGDMTATYVFAYLPEPNVLYVLQQFDLLPRPAGVEINVLINPGDGFGFAPFYLNFENGNFYV